jgi:hypothetical protein
MRAEGLSELNLRLLGQARTVVIAAVLIALLVAGGSIVVLFSRAGTGNTVSQAPTSSTVISSGGLVITGVNGDVVSTNHPEALSSNSSTIVGPTPFMGTPGETFTLRYDIVYQACACGPRVVEVDSLTPGFTVVGTTPSLPVPFQGAGGDFYQAGFAVEVRAPYTPYTGPLTLVAHIE